MKQIKQRSIQELQSVLRNQDEAAFGLMLLVLKDLWTGDLSIGGEKAIGRGVFNGIFADLVLSESRIGLTDNLEALDKLQTYVEKLIIEVGGLDVHRN